MGFRFRKSVKIAPGVRLNFGKKSTSVSFGGKGARYTVSSTGRKTASVGIPGTGLSYVETVSGKKTGKEKSKMFKKKEAKEAKAKKPFFKKWWFWTILVGIVFSIATGGGTNIEDDTMQQIGTNIVAVEESENQTEVESVVTEEPVDPAPEVEEETEVPDPVTEEPKPVTEEETEPPVEEPKVEAPVVETPVVTPVPESPVVEEPKPETPKVEAPVVTQPSGTTAEKPVEKTYVLNTNTMKFHKESCGSVKDILDHNKGSYTGSRDDLIAKGYAPCGRCHP